jgi:UDP-N-acetylmuramyl pentapeptide phosphotransferase/UDP-N-acetylglucosamine-1-phosphate transferase
MGEPGSWRVAGELALGFVAAALICAGLIRALFPLLIRYALARPNARSAHRTPTPQGGGIAVVAATVIVVATFALLAPHVFAAPARVAWVFAATVALAMVGAVDDIRPLGALTRLVLQGIAAVVALAALPAELRALPMLPWWIERALLFAGLLWFVNLVNFMDGIDWMTVAEAVPVSAALALFGLAGALPADATAIAVVLCGALVGFAPFNRPVARLFLGDVGSLPLGLLLGYLLILLAAGHPAAALLLPLYYLADATITLLRRAARGEPLMQAHRSHFYQHALHSGGLSVMRIVTCVFALNVALAALAAATLFTDSRAVQIGAVAAGAVLVGLLLAAFARRK